MSKLIPPLLSSSPPPIVGPLDDEDDDEFGDFRAAADSYDCDDISLPPSPEKELKTNFSQVSLDINSNASKKVGDATQNLNGSILKETVDKDFQDRRKTPTDDVEANCSDSQSSSPPNSLDNQNNVDLFESSEEQGDKSDNVEDFSDLHTAAEGCDVNQSEFGDFANFSEESESVHEKTTSKDLSEMNGTSEIKSEEEFNSEITDKDNEKENDSSKQMNDNFSESSVSIKVCETDPKLSDDEDFGDFENHFTNEVEEKSQFERQEDEEESQFERHEDEEKSQFEIHEDEEESQFEDHEEEEEEKSQDDEFDDFVEPPQTQQQNDDFGDFESSDFGDFSSQSCEKQFVSDVNEKNALEKSETILKEIFPSEELQVDDFKKFNETNGNTIFEELKDVTETKALIYQWSKSNSQKMFLKSLNIDARNILYGPAWNSSMPRFAANLGLAPLEPVKTEILTPTPVQNVSSPSNSSQKNNTDIPTAQFDWSGSGLINPLDSTPTELPGNVPEESSQAQVQNDFLPTTTTENKQDSIPSLFETEIIHEKANNEQPENNVKLPEGTTEQTDNFSPFHSPKLIPLRETHISTELNDLYNKPGWLQPTIVTPDLPRKETVIDPEDDDEFDDFQMVLPDENKKKVVEVESKNNPVTLPSEFEVASVNKTSHNQEHIFGIIPNSGPKDSQVLAKPNNVNVKEEEDEFTEFHSSLPPTTEILKPLQPIPLEPLKPTVQYSQPTTTMINWPDPGVTDDDIRNIELTYSRKNESKPEPVKKSDNSVDDDEWTDFVSVTNPLKPVLPERTSTPDLPLSVLNLNNVQAPKQPIPVITPSGLVQTKLSSNMKSVVQTTVQPNLFRPPTTQFHPSIISNQFAANFFPTSTSKSQTQDDDDDWSDFVSGQPLPQMNGHQSNKAKTPQVNRTNIIMNPTHFQNYVPPRNTIPSISAIPDLDFIAPKNRTSKK